MVSYMNLSPLWTPRGCSMEAREASSNAVLEVSIADTVVHRSFAFESIDLLPKSERESAWIEAATLFNPGGGETTPG